MPRINLPSATFTSPLPPKSVTAQPVKVLPSNRRNPSRGRTRSLVEVAGRAGAADFGTDLEALGEDSGRGGCRGVAHPGTNHTVPASSATARECAKKFLVLWGGRQDECMSG